jgi:polar amino acid transport system substrate-binding protein
VDYEPLFIPPGRAQRIMEQGKWCISFFPPNQQDKKAKFILLSPNHVKLGLYRINQHKAFNYSSLSELQGSVAILRTNSLGLMHSILEGAGLKLVHVETIEQGIHMLLAGRVDYTFGDNTTINTYSEIKGINTLQFSDVPLSEFPVGFYYNLDCEEVLFKAKP